MMEIGFGLAANLGVWTPEDDECDFVFLHMQEREKLAAEERRQHEKLSSGD